MVSIEGENMRAWRHLVKISEVAKAAIGASAVSR